MRIHYFRMSTAALCLAILPALGQDLPKADVLMDKLVEVTGGKEAHSKIKSYVITGTFEMPAQAVNAKMSIHRGDNKSLLQIDIPNFGMIEEGYDGQVAWAKNPMAGARIKDGAEKDLAVFGAHTNPELNWRDLYSSVETTGTEDVNGAPCYKIELVTKQGGMKMHRWHDQKTGLLIKTSMTVTSPEGTVPVESYMHDYKKDGDLTSPHRIEQNVAGQTMTLKFDTVKYNELIDGSKFALPADVKALLEKK